MNVETVEVRPRPMLYLTRRAAMADIGRTMGEMFEVMGRFIGARHVPVAGPPLAIYRDHAADGVTIDLGFPIAPGASAMAAGEIRAGTTPGGRAARAVHHGPYDGLRATYAELGAYLAKRGLAMPARSWEVYVNEPGKVPAADLATEIFLPLPT